MRAKIVKQYGFRPYGSGLVFLLVLGIGSGVLNAQLTARGLGMGTAYTALARGVHAPTWNPANLGLPDNPKFSMSFIDLGLSVNNNSFTLGDYNQYVGQHWSEADEDYILGQVPGSGLRFNVRTNVRVLSFSAGQFAMVIGGQAGSYVQMDRDFISLAFDGNVIGQSYSLDQTGGQMMGVLMGSLSWGQPIEVEFADYFSIGGTLRLFQGVLYANIEKADLDFITIRDNFNIDANYLFDSALPDSEGIIQGDMGFGLDIGAAAQIHEDLTISLGLANLFASMKWPEPDSSMMGYFRGNQLTVEGLRDGLADSSWSEYPIELASSIPVVLRLGAAYRENDFIITGDYVQGFRKSAWVTTTPRFSFGTEWQGVKWLPLRTGISMGGRIGFGTSFGFGIRAGGFKLDLGMMNRGFFWPSSSKGLLFALDIGLELQPPEE